MKEKDEKSEDTFIHMDGKAFNELLLRLEQSMNLKLSMHLEKIFTRIEVRKQYESIELFRSIYLTQGEAARAMKCSIRSVQLYTKAGKLNSIKREKKVWYKIGDIIDFLEGADRELPDLTRQFAEKQKNDQ